ncbi:transporter substrate-binding domain-containing protein [Eubacterium sp. MSJ-21]|nr:transporter substrate-binding domain-containing protein [Eubacterium sp. MSJ-21]
MRVQKIRQLMAACIAGCLLLTGCGTTVTEDTQQLSDLPQLVIGSDSYEPFNYINEDGEFAGVDVELAQEACRRIGYEPVFTQIVWEGKDEYLKEGSVDCLWGSFTMTGREDEYTWVGPYLNSRQVVVVRTDSDIYQLSDLEGKRVSVQATSKPEREFLNQNNPSTPQVGDLFSFSSMDEIYASLRKGYVDAIAGHESALRTFVETDPENYRILDESLYNSELGVAFSKDSTDEAIGKLAQALNEMREDGTTRQIIEKYGLNPKTAFGDMKDTIEVY